MRQRGQSISDVAPVARCVFVHGANYAAITESVSNFVSHSVTQMTQHPLFKDLSSDRLAAIGADVDAAGGEKIVGATLWPKLAPETAGRKLANALNPKQRHELTDEEVWTIKQMAYEAVGRSRLVEFECGALQADLHWITKQEQLERKEQRLEALLEQIHGELQEWKAAKQAVK